MPDPLAIIGVFTLGASAGSLITHLMRRGPLLGYGKGAQALSRVIGESPATNYRMKALVVCRSPEVVAIFSELLREICVQVEKCASVSQALSLLSSQKFEALVLDFDNLASCAEIARSVREIRPNQAITIFAIASEEQQKSQALAMGSTFVIEQPLVPEQIRNLLRTSYGRMLRSSQAYFRFNIEIPVSVAKQVGPVLPCTTINLSQNGMAINTPKPLERGEKLHLVFALPNSDVVMSAEGTVIWDDGHGKAGIRFEGSSASTKARYFEWLHDHFFLRFEHSIVNPEAQSLYAR